MSRIDDFKTSVAVINYVLSDPEWFWSEWIMFLSAALFNELDDMTSDVA